MEAGPSSAPGMRAEETSVEPLDELRVRVQRAKSERASLQAEIDRLKNLPAAEQVRASKFAAAHPLPAALVELSKEVALAEDRCILYRTAGWTVFEIDLDLGRREREQRRGEGASRLGKTSLGLGVRIETFWRGRFHEPYYLVFAKRSQLLHGKERVSGAALDVGHKEALLHRLNDEQNDEESDTPGEFVRLVRHTIPHFVPLQILLKRFLGQGARASAQERGGLELLESLSQRQGFSDFLSNLHDYLQAFVSRREQTIALRTLPLPSSRLEAYGNDDFSQIAVHFMIPDVKSEDIERYEESMGIDRASQYESMSLEDKRSYQTRLYVHARLQGKQKRTGIRPYKAVHVNVHIKDLSQDRPGAALEEQPLEKHNGQQSTACLYGAVRVEEVRHVLRESRGKRRTERIPIWGTGKIVESMDELALRYHRRQDLEQLLTNESVDISRSIEKVINVIWREEVAAHSHDRWTYQHRRGKSTKLNSKLPPERLVPVTSLPAKRNVLQSTDDEAEEEGSAKQDDEEEMDDWEVEMNEWEASNRILQ